MRRTRAHPAPVSCQSCRSKKLKCNRIQPCSNCVARGITCSFLGEPQRQADAGRTTENITDLVFRISRLESIVFKHDGLTGPTANDTLMDGHDTGQASWASDPESLVVVDNHEESDRASSMLENVGTREDLLVCNLWFGTS